MYTVRKATLDDLPTLLEFEQGLIEAERPMDPTIRSGNISYYDISLFIKNESPVFAAPGLSTKLLVLCLAKIQF